jgi:multidrug efflux pump subunit AcrA (membrane-fusion protein)
VIGLRPTGLVLAVAVGWFPVAPLDGAPRVYVQRNPEAFDLKEVKTGTSNGTYIEITEGLREGDRIVTRGGEKMPRK